MKKVLITMVLFTFALSVFPAYYLAGSFGDKMGGSNWVENDPNLELTDPDSDGIFTKTVTFSEAVEALASSNGWKVTDGTWSNSFPGNGNISFKAGAGETVTFFYDTNTYTDGFIPTTKFAYTSNQSESSAGGEAKNFVGSFNGWNNNDSAMVPSLGSGIVKAASWTVPSGTTSIEWKICEAGDWNSYDIMPGNQTLSGLNGGDVVYFNWDPSKNRCKASVGATPVNDWSLY